MVSKQLVIFDLCNIALFALIQNESRNTVRSQITCKTYVLRAGLRDARQLPKLGCCRSVEYANIGLVTLVQYQSGAMFKMVFTVLCSISNVRYDVFLLQRCPNHPPRLTSRRALYRPTYGAGDVQEPFGRRRPTGEYFMCAAHEIYNVIPRYLLNILHHIENVAFTT